MPSANHLAALVLVVATVAGCAGDSVLSVDRWQLIVDGQAIADVQLPAHLDETVEPEVGQFRLTSRVALPERMADGPLTFTLLATPAVVELLVDGREAVSLEHRNRGDYRTPGWHAWRLPDGLSAGDTVELTMVVDNRWGQATWFDSAPRLSATAAGDAGYLATRAWNQWTAGATITLLVLLTLVYGTSFVMDRRRRSEAWFAVVTGSTTIVVAYFAGFTQSVLGTYDGPVALAALTIAVLATVHFTHHLFALGSPARWWWSALVLLVLVEIVFAGPYRTVRYAVPVMALFFGPAIVYQLVLLVQLRRRQPPPRHSGSLLICWSVVLVTAALWMLPWLDSGGPWAGVFTLPAGIAFYAVVQSIAISRDRSEAVHEAHRLTGLLEARIAELEAREHELDLLNQKLRGHIAQRSGRLAQALAGMQRLSQMSEVYGDRDWADRVLGELAQLLASLHGSGIAHGYLSIESVWMSDTGRPVLPPARAQGSGTEQSAGDLASASTVAIGASEQASLASDVRAFGHIASKLYGPAGSANPSIDELIERCLAADPVSRPSAAELARAWAQ